MSTRDREKDQARAHQLVDAFFATAGQFEAIRDQLVDAALSETPDIDSVTALYSLARKHTLLAKALLACLPESPVALWQFVADAPASALVDPWLHDTISPRPRAEPDDLTAAVETMRTLTRMVTERFDHGS